MSAKTSSKKVFLGLTWLPWLVVCISLCATWVMQSNARRDEHRALQAEFDFRAAQIADLITARLDVDEQLLQGLRGLFTLSGRVERRDFAGYVSQQQLAQRFPGVTAVGYSPLVPASALTRHETQMRVDGPPDYRIWPEGARTAYAPLAYVEPSSAQNLRALGYDPLSEPSRRNAMELAGDTNLAIMTGTIELVQEMPAIHRTGVIMFLPIYRPDLPRNTVAQRHEALVGWVETA